MGASIEAKHDYGLKNVGVMDEKSLRAFPLKSVNESNEKVDIAKPRFDLSTYSGRLSHFYSTTSPLTLFYSTTSLQEAQKHVKEVEANFSHDKQKSFLVTRKEAERYWKSKQLVESSVHPDTGEVIPLPFRMSAFVPTNLLVVGGMLSPSNGLPATIFWQWVNQSLNVAVNYSNANKSVPMDMKEVGTAYAGATGAAVALAVGLTRIVTPGTLLARLVPFASVASAGCVNVSLMRWKEIRDGVTVFRTNEETGEKIKVGDSPAAGRRAVAMTAASRVMTNIPTMIFPPLAIAYLQRKRVLPKAGPLTRLADLTLIGTSLFLCLPPAIAYFPQTSSIDASKLEPQFHQIKDEQGKHVQQLQFNKGL
ncbi:Tricarboxylate/iron carrier [Meira miltonrushii]|uniref:Sidoreflexin n=1 Tax=Meira miltonrushii TaxID=1280837 RepID=A0A316VCE0_9BASI|nr:Tricarboxylate/iron carrier [Meira miltonrushii]PWN35299.1 Tricarboxylate/iron carrier [Meira miltonrushii]